MPRRGRKTKTHRPSFAHKMQNRRFRRTEDSILTTLYHNRHLPSARMIAYRAKISPSTFYRHHKNSYTIIPDLEHLIYLKYQRFMRPLLGHPKVHLRTLYLQTLIFILKNRHWFRLVQSHDGGHLIESMLYVLAPKINSIYHLPPESTTVIRVYTKELAGLLEIWIESDFKASENDVLADLIYLSKNLPKKLTDLSKQN